MAKSKARGAYSGGAYKKKRVQFQNFVLVVAHGDPLTDILIGPSLAKFWTITHTRQTLILIRTSLRGHDVIMFDLSLKKFFQTVFTQRGRHAKNLIEICRV